MNNKVNFGIFIQNTSFFHGDPLCPGIFEKVLKKGLGNSYFLINYFQTCLGIDKHFQMAIIWSRFVSQSKKSVSSEVLWKKLNSLYNLKYFNDTEPIPFDRRKKIFFYPLKSFESLI